MTWGLMLLTVFAGGMRPSCICADGTLCLLCPKLMAVPAVLPLAGSAAVNGSCSSKSCCREHASVPTQPKSTSVFELAGSECEGRDCLTIQAASPVIVQSSDDPTSHLNCDVVPAMFANAELSLARESSRLTGSAHWVGSPPDLIVLYQRWLI